MPTKPKTEAKTEAVAADAPGHTSKDPAMAIGPVGQLPAWDRPDAKFAEDDTSIDARMWRVKQDHIAMGSRQ